MPTTKNGNSFLDVFDSKSLWHTSWLAQSVERLGGRELCQGSLDCEVGGNGLGGWTWESKRQSVASISLLARRTTVISVFSLLLFLPPCWFYASRTTQGRLGRLPNDSRKIPPLILLHLFPPFISLTPGLSVGARAPYGYLRFYWKPAWIGGRRIRDFKQTRWGGFLHRRLSRTTSSSNIE